MSMKENLAIVILAAGKGTRMKSALPKVMHPVAGRPMINWLIETAEKLNPQKIIVVTAPDMDAVAKAVAPHETIIQKDQKGTGDAAAAALPALKGFKGKVLILLGDEPFVPLEAMERMIAWDGLSVMAVRPVAYEGLGRMITHDDGTLERIVEERDATDDEKEIDLCNAGNFCVPSEHLEKWLSRIKNDNTQNEFYLTALPGIAEKDGFLTMVVEADVARMRWGVNTRSELSEREREAQHMLREAAMENGATLLDPETTYFSFDTQLGRDVIVGPNVFFGPGVSVGDNTVINAFCHLEGATLAAGIQVGPFARLRPGTHLEDGAKIGNFVETKNAHFGKGSKANHLSYVGDAEVGAGSNIGAGTITCNYDGFDKHKTQIGDGVFVGSNSTLVAPITLSDGAYIAAGSVITENIPADALAVARNRPIIRDGWAAVYRNDKKNKKESA